MGPGKPARGGARPRVDPQVRRFGYPDEVSEESPGAARAGGEAVEATRVEGVVAATQADAPAPEPAPAPLQVPLTDLIKARLRREGEGGRIGRYVILRLLGEGGMGSVFAAYDGELDRKVAIKLLRADAASGPFDRTWLLGEAKAMARLSHPNVVQIYDVGEVDDHVFIAMEMVAGMTLRQWLKSKKRSWQEVARVFVEAGRGLQAVHAAGLVHRDFKPQNVLVGDDGRSRVLDFGLAHGSVDVGGMRDLSSSVSQASGTIVGTPAYMAPEQLAGLEVDARSDVFAFCVALYEALYGVRPFGGDKLPSIVAAIQAGEVRPPPPESRVPARIRRAVFRGLKTVPAERWPSVAALLAVLEDHPGRRWALAGVGAAALLAVTALGWSLHRQRELEAESARMVCVGGDSRVAEAWGEGPRGALTSAFEATKMPFAADAASAAIRRLDDYSAELAASYRSICEEHRSGELTDSLYERAQSCLGADLLALQALAGVLTAADGKVVEEAVKALGSLPRIDACRDRAALVAQVLPPSDPRVASEVQRLREALAVPRAAMAAGKIRECAAAIGPLVDEARALGYTALIAEGTGLLGLCHELAGDYEAAEKSDFEALSEGLASGYDPLATDLAIRVVRVVGLRRGRFAEADLWARLARGLVRRRGERPEEVARLEATLAGLSLLQGRPEEALAGYDRALARFEAASGRANVETVTTLNNRGAALHALGRNDELRKNLEDAADRTRELLGPRHPTLGTILSNLGNIHLRAGSIDAAVAVQREAIALKEATLGGDHPELATLLMNLGEALCYAGDLEGAEGAFTRALAIREAAMGGEHPAVAEAVLNLGNFFLIWKKEPARARSHLERASALLRAQLPAEHPRIGTVTSLLGRADVLTGRRASGLARLEAALRSADRGAWLAEDGAEVRYFLADGLWEKPRERARARLLVEEALVGYRKAGPLHARHVAAVEAWMRERGLVVPPA